METEPHQELGTGVADSNTVNNPSVAQSNQPIEQHSFPADPNTYPAQPGAGVHVVWTVMVKINSPGTSVIIDSFTCDTNLTNYPTDIPASAVSAYSYIYSQQALPADLEVHWRVKIDNTTAPAMRMGGYPLPKEALDGHLTSWNITCVEDIYRTILVALPQMQSRARY